MGYHRSGWDVTGVDRRKPSSYPAGEFIEADALDVLSDSRFMARFDAVHISPPCQDYIAITAGTNARLTYPRLLEPARSLLQEIGLPYVIECGDGKHLRRDLQLCGEMFGLRVIRHRTFEVGGWTPAQPAHVKHRGRVKGWRHGVKYDGYYYAVYGDGGGKGTVAEWQEAMGIDWTADRFELREAIPPAYTEFIGAQMLEQIGQVAA
jgi:DNA (cytosine-5)-methyltransferase 1